MKPSLPDSSDPIEQTAARWIVRRDRGLTPEETAAFAAWRNADPRHADAVAQLESAWDYLGKPRSQGQSALLLRRLGQRARSRRRRRAGVAAAALLAVVALGWLWQSPRQEENEALGTAPTRAVVITPAMQTLPDGSVVELRFGAQLAVDFKPEVRRVVLRQGEAHFAVTKDPQRPFIVSAGGVEFRAVGTAFSVQVGRNRVEMLVTEGRVAVAPTHAAAGDIPEAAGSAPVVVDAGKGIVVGLAGNESTASNIITLTPAELTTKLAWRAPRLEFTDTPLAEAVALMNQHAAGRGTARLVLEDDASAQLPVSGIFRADNTAAFVRILEVNFGLKAVADGDTLTLKRTP